MKEGRQTMKTKLNTEFFVRAATACGIRGGMPAPLLVVLLGLLNGAASAANFTKVTGEESPGVVITDESFSCWFSPDGYGTPSGSSTSLSGITYNSFGQVTGYHASVSRSGGMSRA